MLICPVFQKHNFLKKACTQQGAAPASRTILCKETSYQFNFRPVGLRPAGRILSFPAVSYLLWKFFQKKSKKEAFSGQQRVSQD